MRPIQVPQTNEQVFYIPANHSRIRHSKLQQAARQRPSSCAISCRQYSHTAKANQFRLDKEYDSAISLLDSAFLLPVKSDQHPNGLPPDDARRLMSYAIRHLMFAYNHSRRIAEGHKHFLRLREMNHPILSNHCQREIFGMRRTKCCKPSAAVPKPANSSTKP